MCNEVIGQVVEVPDRPGGVAVVRVGESLRRVSLVLLELDGVQAVPGDWVRSHTGLATDIITAVEAAEITSYTEQLAIAS